MKNVDTHTGKLLFDRIVEVVSNERLTPKERIPKLRTILDELFKALTTDSKVLLSSLSSRSIYIFREFDVPKDIEYKTDSLRKLANKVVHESEIIPNKKDEVRSLYHLSEVISYFSKEPIPENILNIYKPFLDEILKSPAIKKDIRPSYDFYAIVESVYFPQNEAAGKFCTLTCNTDELGVIRLKLWNNKKDNGFGSDLSVFGKLVEPYQNIYVTNVKQVADKENDYYATDQSLIILEPDYLLDAKELSECRQFNSSSFGRYEDNPLLFILNRFTKGVISDRMMVGNIVGKMLDDIVTEKDYNYKDSFESVMRENSFGMLCIANEEGEYNRAKIGAIYIEAKDHEKQLLNTLKVYKGHQQILEPTFISNKYGLQGRLDLLVDFGPDSNRKDIIELKSSKNYPGNHLALYLNHEAQTMCYDLLVSSTFPDRIGASSILYSSAPLEEKPLRNVAEEKFLSKQELLMLRNRIVSGELKLADGDFKPFLNILEDDFGPYPKFLEDQLNDFIDTIHGFDDLLKAYFFGYLKFIYKELQVAKIGSKDTYSKSNGYAELWKASKTEKIENYDVLIYLKIKEVTDNFHLILEFDNNIYSGIATVSSFRVGDSAILYPTTDPEELHPLKSQILKCHVIAVDYNSVEISLTNKQIDASYFKTSKYWALDRDFREYGYKQLLQLLFEFIKSDKQIIDLVLGLKRPEFIQSEKIERNELDAVQYENVTKAIQARDYYLIQGPPGTGKTSKVLVEIVRNLSLKGNSIMIVAFTNRAVDEICERLIELQIKCIRFGKGDKKYYWSDLAKNLKLDELNDVVKQNHVFVSTISTFATSLDILKFKKFDTLIIDEASQVLEPQIVGVLKYFQKWIFIGDENQLPAVVLQSEEDSIADNEQLLNISLNNFRESLFYRLKKNAVAKNWNDCYGELKFQYRMHVDIAEFPNRFFYDNKLKEVDESQRSPLPNYSSFNENVLYNVISKSRVVFIPTKADLNAKINREEANLAAALIKYISQIFGEKFDPKKTVGVITPFRAQIANIRNNLGQSYRDVTIDTVERFQGSERNIIIYSFAIKSTTQIASIQSLNDNDVDRKLNVALTRAKDQLIILGTEEVLSKNKLYKSLIDFIKSKKGYMINPYKLESLPTNLF